MTLAARGLSIDVGRRRIVADASFTLRPGALVGVLGPNGAGKSTLVRALLGLAPAATGSVLVDDRPLATIRRGEIARTVAYLPQGGAVHWPLEVERLVALGRLPHLGPLSRLADGDRDAVARAMARAGVAHLAARTATEVSGGERARILLARALAVEAPALVVDEPLASLDPAHQIAGMACLRAEADAGALVVAVLHDLTLALRHCDRVLVLSGGRLVADGPPRDVLTPALLAGVYGITALHLDTPAPALVPLDRID